MPIEVTDLVNELDADEVQQTQELLAQLMQEFNPRIDTKRGVLHDLLFYLEAVYAEKNGVEIDRLRRSQSLLEASQDPQLADAEIIDAIASNFLVTRKSGGTANGEITIVVSTLEPLTIAAGSVWEANGQQFVNAVAFAAVTAPEGVTSSTDRVLNPVGDGTYAFSIDVVAVEEGTAGLVLKNTLFVPQVTPLNFVKAFAASDFIGGSDSETNAELIDRLLEGVACKALSGSVSMNAALRAQEDFKDVMATSIIGFGDSEMIRDQHSIFPGSLGGRVDWYVRTQERVQRVGLVKTAVLVEKQPDGTGIWQFGIGRDDAPGFYDVLSVLPRGLLDATTLTIISDTRGMDLTSLGGDGFLPDLQTASEAAYSRFQTSVVRFQTLADEFDLDEYDVGEEEDFDVTLRALPLIGGIQSWASGRDVRNRAGDALIKSPVPCFVSVSFTIELAPGQESPDVEQIKTDIAQLINRRGFTGRLPTSAISDVIHNQLVGTAHTGAVDVLGEIRFPDGELRRVRTTSVLVIPNEPQRMVSPRTVAFFCSPDDIAISVETADMPLV